MIPIVSTLDRGEFTVKLRAFSSQREDYEEIPIKVDVSYEYFNIMLMSPVMTLTLVDLCS